MLRTEHMQKVRIVCLYDDKHAVTAALHNLGCVDLRKSRLDLSEDTHPLYFTELSDMLIKVGGALGILRKMPVTPGKHVDVKELISEVNGINHVLDKTYALDSERKSLLDDVRLLDYGAYVAEAFSGLDINFSSMHSDFLGYKAFETDAKTAREFQKEVNTAGLDVEVITNALEGKKALLFITYPREINVDSVLKRFKMTELDLNSKYLSDMPRNVSRSIHEKRKQNRERVAAIEKELAEISSKHYSKLAGLQEMLDVEVARAEASSMFRRTDRSLVIEGWVPKKRVGELNEALRAATKGRFELDELAPDELAPTLVSRGRFLRPFYYLVEFFSVPRSDEIDPTWIFIFFFPIFYGLMISDVGYGIASLLLATWITRISDPDDLLYNVAKVWQICSVSAAFFGILSDQYFGLQLNQYWLGRFGFSWLSLISFDWAKDIVIILVLSIGFGVAQILIGLLFGVVNNYRKGNMKHAAAKAVSITTIIFGIIAIAGGLFGAFGPGLTKIGTALAIVSAILVIVLSGEEAVEIVSLIGHPLSYARLMGFGLASVIIALLIDKSFTPSLSQGPILFIIYLLIFIVLHLLNMVLSMFEGMVQGVRLNFIEFFSKFYTGGGVRFKPFYYRRRYTAHENNAKHKK